MVSDLLNNAERRAVQKHYDDAIARLYRATELFAQIRLQKEHGYNSGELSLDKLPENLQADYREHVRDNKLVLGLMEDYILLSKLRDPIGLRFDNHKGRITDAIKRRNSSISGHGQTPLTAADYLFVRDRIKGFIRETAGEIGLDIEMEQLPGREIL